MANPVQLEVVRKQEPEVVAYLENELERAKAGEINGVLILTQDREGLKYSIAGVKDRFLVMGWMLHALYKLQSDG